MAIVSRDTFAREELHRTAVHAKDLSAGRTCDWCGGRNGHGGLFRYRTESDAGRSNTHKGLFCSKSCHNTYHGS